MSYNLVKTFWNDLINMEAKNWIKIFLTFAIALFAFLQWLISRQKRKDDLFKIRWKFYQDIIKFIRNINFHLDELIYSNPLEKNKEILWNSSLYAVQEVCAERHLELDQDQIDKRVLEAYEHQLKNLYIFHNLEIMLALYDITQGNKSFWKSFREGEVHLKVRGFIQKSEYLFGNDVSKFLEQFLSINKLEEIYQKYYSGMIERFGLDNDILKKRIEIYGWSVTTDSLIRSSRNKIPSINKINNITLQYFEKENTEDLNKLNKFICFLKDKSITFRTVAGLLEDDPDFKELEQTFNKYLKLK
jgi:hypothetical protein